MRSQNWCLTIPKLVPDDPKTGAWQLSGPISGIVSEIPNMMPDNWLRNPLVVVPQKPSVGHHSSSGIIFGISEAIPEIVPDDCQAPFLGPSSTSFGIVRHQFWDRQAPVLWSSGTSFGISRFFLGYKKEPKRCNEGCFGVFKGVLELPYVNICYIIYIAIM